MRNAHTHSGDSSENLLPPSTIAAQLVKNHAEYVRGNRHTDDAATFRQLLQEILSRDSAPETDVGVNHKLIQVVVEAGLDMILHDNPFAEWDILIPQALDSLAVIESTISRQPEILLYEESSSAQSHKQPQLLVWLLPKIFCLSCHPRCSELQHALASVLQCMVTSLSSTLKHWQHSQILIDTFQECVKDLIRDSITFEYTTYASVGTALPPGRSLATLWPQAEHAVALPSAYQMLIKDAASASKIILLLLGAISELCRSDGSLPIFKAVPNTLSRWVLDVLPTLIHSLLKHRQYFELHGHFSALSVHSIHIYQQNLSLLRRLQTIPKDESPYTTIRFCQSCAEYMLASCDHTLTTDVQEALGVAIQASLDTLSRHHETIVEEFLLPSLTAFASDEARFRACPDALLISVRTWLTRLARENPVWVTSVPRDQGDTDMTDVPGAGEDAQKSSAVSTTKGRRKLRGITSKHDQGPLSTVDLYSRLVGQLVRMLGADGGQEIAGLSDTAL